MSTKNQKLELTWVGKEHRCEWGKDDYSLKVESLPQAPAKAGQQDLFEDEEEGA